jgi:hypothetical protein
MSTSASSVGKQDPSTALSFYYGPLGPFASPEGRLLSNDAFGRVLSFLHPKDLARVEGVCRSWKRFINETDQWKRQCEIHLNSGAADPRTYFPACNSYKESLRLVFSRVYDEKTYQYYLGAQVEPFPRIPEAPSLRRFNEPDPWDPTQTIGQNYFWIDSPPYFEIPVDGDFPFELDKTDDPNDEEAPRLIQKEVALVESVKRKIGLGSEPEKNILKVPNTINNLGVLFKHPKNGSPSAYGWVLDSISKQHGNKRIPQGRICMREDVIGRSLTFNQQQAAATQAGVVIPQLGHRILFDFLRHAKTNTYPDGQNPWTFARTSTLTLHPQGTAWPSACGFGGPSGLSVYCDSFIDNDSVGAALALPEEVQAIGPFFHLFHE